MHSVHSVSLSCFDAFSAFSVCLVLMRSVHSVFLFSFDACSVVFFVFLCIQWVQCFCLVLMHSVHSVSSRDIFTDLWENGLCNHLIWSSPTDCPPD